MKRGTGFIGVLVALALWSGTALAQTAPPVPIPIAPPPTGPPAVTQPGLGAWVVRDANNFDASYLPYDFQFTDMVDGWGFKPDERVTVTTEHVNAQPVVVTANDGGSFSVRISFSWRFCGAGGEAAPPPRFVAQGDAGTSAQTDQSVPQCPTISAVARPRPVESTSSPAGGANGATVATSPPNVAAPPATLVPSVPPTNPPLPAPSPSRPVTLTFEVHGFGFARDEAVRLQTFNVGGDSPAPVSLIADTAGRIQTSLTLTLMCTGGRPWPELRAEGNRGTSMAATLACWQWYGCEPPRMCPVPAPAPDPIPPLLEPGAPTLPAAMTNTTEYAGVTSTLHVSKPYVRRGARQTAIVRAAGITTVALTLRYAGGRVVTMHKAMTPLGATSERRAVFMWTVPRDEHGGVVRVAASFAGDSPALQTAFRVR